MYTSCVVFTVVQYRVMCKRVHLTVSIPVLVCVYWNGYSLVVLYYTMELRTIH